MSLSLSGELPSKRRLLRTFSRLSDVDQQAVLAFAEFLVQRDAVEEPSHDADKVKLQPVPQPISRPDEESVVAAMQRLSKTYYMLNKDALLHQAAELMSQHILEGVSAHSVINELEALFADTYKSWVDGKSE